MTRTLAVLLVLSLTCNVWIAIAAEGDAPPETPQPEARSSTTRHQITIEGGTVDYTATAGWLKSQPASTPSGHTSDAK